MDETEEKVTLDEAIKIIIDSWDWDDCIDCLNDYISLDDLQKFLENRLTNEQKLAIYNAVEG